MIEWLNDWMIEHHFYPFFEKKMSWGIVSSGIQSMVNDAYFFDDAFYFNLFKTLFIQSFIYIQSFIFTPIPIISNHFYPFLSNSKFSFKFQNI